MKKDVLQQEVVDIESAPTSEEGTAPSIEGFALA
jgi:hypothetical protein